MNEILIIFIFEEYSLSGKRIKNNPKTNNEIPAINKNNPDLFLFFKILTPQDSCGHYMHLSTYLQHLK